MPAVTTEQVEARVVETLASFGPDPDRFSQFALVAAGEALAQAGWEDAIPYDPLRVGCVIATGIGGQATIEAQLDVLRERGPRMVSPLGIPQYMPNAAAAAVSMKYHL